MKVAPLWHALAAAPDFTPVLVHTGQHYDANMSDAIFADLRLPEPDHHLGVGSGSHAEQTGRVMIAYEKVALSDRPDWLIVVGDVNSTAACAMVGAKLGIPVVHLEAGLRSRDRTMPEELNRLVTDVLADVLWTPSPDGDENLLAEGIPAGADHARRQHHDRQLRADPSGDRGRRSCRGELGLAPGGYGVVTLHRPSNVDDPAQLVAAGRGAGRGAGGGCRWSSRSIRARRSGSAAAGLDGAAGGGRGAADRAGCPMSAS